MTPEQRNKIREKILGDILKLETEVQNLSHQTKPIAPDNAIGRLSRMEAINSKSIQEAALRNSKQKLSQLKIMIKKVDLDDFGLCRICDEEIPLARLLAMPEKEVCVDCAQKRPS